MRENGQIFRAWKKWGSDFSKECLKKATGQPMKIHDVMVAFTILLGSVVLGLILLLAEKSTITVNKTE